MTHEREQAADEGAPKRDVALRMARQEPVTRASPRAVAAVLIAGAVFLYLVRSILLPFVISGAVAFVCAPLIAQLERVGRFPRWLAAVLVCCTVFAIGAALAYLAIPTLVHETASTISNLRATIEHTLQAVFGNEDFKPMGQPVDVAQITSQIMDALQGAFGRADVAAGVIAGSSGMVLGTILTIVLFVYFMVGGPAVAAGLLWLVPPKQRPLALSIWTELDPILFRYFAGLAVVVAYATAAAYAGLALVLHLPNAAMLAVITGLLEIVPIVGPAASALIAGLFAVHGAADGRSIVAYVIYVIVFRLSVDQVVSPLVLGRAGRVHPVVIIFSFLAGGTLFGIAGIILAIPVALAIKTVLVALYDAPAAE